MSPRLPTLSTSCFKMTFMIMPLFRPASILDVVQESHQPRSLDGRGQPALMKGAGPGDPAGRDLAPVRDVLAQDVHVLIVDVLEVPLTEPAEIPFGRKI